MRPPDFWTTSPHAPALPARLLAPLAWGYSRLAMRRIEHGPAYRSRLKVVCVGNLTMGGTGKTPVAIAIGEALTGLSAAPVFLTRGYGGRERGPLVVDLGHHSARDVGDEPLLLARASQTIVSADRAIAAQRAEETGANIIVMDDGFQNPSLAKDLSFIVVDAGIGFGNERVFPAGPLREPLDYGLARADAIIMLGPGGTPVQLTKFSGPVLWASFVPDTAALEKIRGRRIAAFAGIGRPAKFFETLERAGAALALAQSFPDHHPFSDHDVAQIRLKAKDLPIITTEKDFVRMSPTQRTGIEPFPVRVAFDDRARLLALLSKLRAAPAESTPDPSAR